MIGLNSIANPDFQTAVGTALQILIVPTHWQSISISVGILYVLILNNWNSIPIGVPILIDQMNWPSRLLCLQHFRI